MKTYYQFLEEASKRIKVLRTKHYTTPENQKEILQKGFKDSPSSGTYHPQGKSVVYTTPSSRVGTDYGTRPVSLRMVNPRVHSTSSPKEYRQNLKSWMKNASDEDLVADKNRPTDPRKQARTAMDRGEKIVRVPDAHENPMRKVPRGSYIMVDKEVANKSIDKNPPPTIRKKKMKTYQQFILEAKQPKPDAIKTIGKNLERRTPGMKVHVYPSQTEDLKLHSLEVPKERRNQGIGSHALENITAFADRQNKRVTLTPEAEKGKKAKLDKFYKRFGFKSNKGRNRDFSVSDTMIRNPNS